MSSIRTIIPYVQNKYTVEVKNKYDALTPIDEDIHEEEIHTAKFHQDDFPELKNAGMRKLET